MTHSLILATPLLWPRPLVRQPILWDPGILCLASWSPSPRMDPWIPGVGLLCYQIPWPQWYPPPMLNIFMGWPSSLINSMTSSKSLSFSELPCLTRQKRIAHCMKELVWGWETGAAPSTGPDTGSYLGHTLIHLLSPLPSFLWNGYFICSTLVWKREEFGALLMGPSLSNAVHFLFCLLKI